MINSSYYATLSTTHGYCFGKGWFVGFGGMIESPILPIKVDKDAREDYPYQGDRMLKLYIDLRKTFALPTIDLFVDVKYGSPNNLAPCTGDSSSVRANMKRGWYHFARPSIGIVIKRHYAFSAGLDWTQGRYFVDTGDCMPYEFKETLFPHIGFAYQF